MTKTGKKTTSGQIVGLSENTKSQLDEDSSWSARTVSIKVSTSGRAERISKLNHRLRGNSTRAVNTSR